VKTATRPDVLAHDAPSAVAASGVRASAVSRWEDDVPAARDAAPSGPSAATIEARARVEAVLASAPELRRGARPAPDRRAFPRCMGALAVQCHAGVSDDPAAAAEWLHEGRASSEVWSPDPFMNFSALGLAFEDEARAREGDTLFLSIRLPREPASFRAVARVLRVSELPADEREPDSRATQRVAVRFDAIDPRGSAALVAYTLRVQAALMEGTRDS
jgi:hypothetical protein